MEQVQVVISCLAANYALKKISSGFVQVMPETWRRALLQLKMTLRILLFLEWVSEALRVKSEIISELNIMSLSWKVSLSISLASCLPVDGVSMLWIVTEVNLRSVDRSLRRGIAKGTTCSLSIFVKTGLIEVVISPSIYHVAVRCLWYEECPGEE